MKGTYAGEVEAALAHFGYRMDLKASYMSRPRKERPTVWYWMQKPRNAWAHYILAVHKGGRALGPDQGREAVRRNPPTAAGPSSSTARIPGARIAGYSRTCALSGFDSRACRHSRAGSAVSVTKPVAERATRSYSP